MVLYFYDEWKKKIEQFKLVRETKCFYFMNKSGPDYTHRIYKDDVGKKVFLSVEEVIADQEQQACEEIGLAAKKHNEAVIEFSKIKAWAEKERASASTNIVSSSACPECGRDHRRDQPCNEKAKPK